MHLRRLQIVGRDLRAAEGAVVGHVLRVPRDDGGFGVDADPDGDSILTKIVSGVTVRGVCRPVQAQHNVKTSGCW